MLTGLRAWSTSLSYKVGALHIEGLVPPEPVDRKIESRKCQGHKLEFCDRQMVNRAREALQNKPSCLHHYESL